MPPPNPYQPPLPSPPSGPLFGIVDEMDEQGTREGVTWSADGHRNYVRTFLVQVLHDDLELLKQLGTSYVCSAPGIPLPGSPYITPYEYDLAAVAVKISARRLQPDSRYWWLVTVEYSTNMPEGGIQVYDAPDSSQDIAAVANSPELRPWHIEWDSKILTRAPQQDLFGFPFWNSAGQPFNPAYSQEIARPVLTIMNNVRFITRQDLMRYSYVANKDTFLGCRPGTVLSHPPRAVLQWYGSIAYYRVRWTLEFGESLPVAASKANWILYSEGFLDSIEPPENYDEIQFMDGEYLLDAGMMRIQNNPTAAGYGKVTPIIGPMGLPVTTPQLLDGDGQPAVPDADGYLAPTYLFFRTRRRVSFAPIFTSGLGGLI